MPAMPAMPNQHPTPYDDVNALLRALHEGVARTLGARFVGMYLYGSLTLDNFTAGSDVDVIVATDGDLSEGTLAALRAMHDRLYSSGMRWVDQLEVVYVPVVALRRHDPEHADFPHLDRGPGEQLRLVTHATDWVVQRALLCERGITVDGPPPVTLIDPISADDVRRAQVDLMRVWWAPMARNAAEANHLRPREYQTYAVLTMCRMLYTLRTGTITSKSAAATWALGVLDHSWARLIEQADAFRTGGPADTAALATEDDIRDTQALIRLTEDECERWAQANE